MIKRTFIFYLSQIRHGTVKCINSATNRRKNNIIVKSSNNDGRRGMSTFFNKKIEM